MESTFAIEIENVTKRFKNTIALDQVTFSIPKGEIFGLLGPNGAGKTTLMRILVGIIGPDEGQVRVHGDRRGRLKERIGYLPEERGLYPKMKVREFLRYCGQIKGIPRGLIQSAISEGLRRVGLEGQENYKVEELSKGNQQRVQLLITLMHKPDILILDEPFTGLDPLGVEQMKHILIEETQRGAVVIISTHRMEDAEQLCRNIALINRGKVICNGPVNEIKQAEGHDELLVEYEGSLDSLPDLPGVSDTQHDNHRIQFNVSDSRHIPVIIRQLSNQADLMSVKRREPTLHDVFIERVRRVGDEHAD